MPEAPRRSKRAATLAALSALVATAASAQPDPTPAAPAVAAPAPVVVPTPAQAAPFLADAFTLGAAEASVEVVEYLSPTCPHCAAFAREVWPKLLTDYVATGRIRLVIRETVTAPSLVAGGELVLARCGGMQGYAAALEKLFTAQAAILSPPGSTLGASVEPIPALLRAGAVLELSEARTRACLADDVAVDALNSRLHAAEAAGVDSTPTFLFDGRVLKPGAHLGRTTYEGGELSRTQFDAAYAAAARRAKRAPAGG